MKEFQKKIHILKKNFDLGKLFLFLQCQGKSKEQNDENVVSV